MMIILIIIVHVQCSGQKSVMFIACDNNMYVHIYSVLWTNTKIFLFQMWKIIKMLYILYAIDKNSKITTLYSIIYSCMSNA